MWCEEDVKYRSMWRSRTYVAHKYSRERKKLVEDVGKLREEISHDEDTLVYIFVVFEYYNFVRFYWKRFLF